MIITSNQPGPTDSPQYALHTTQDPDGEVIRVRGCGRVVLGRSSSRFVRETAKNGVLEIQIGRGPDEDEEYENLGTSLVLVLS